MAQIIVETGSIVANANSYVSVLELSQFAADRGYTLEGDASIRLIKASDYLECLRYKGRKMSRDQSMQWPRYGVTVDGYALRNYTIPKELKKAQMQLAIAIDQGYDPLVVSDAAVKREKVDVIEVEYEGGSSSSSFVLRDVNMSLSKLLSGGVGGNVVIVSKA